MAAIGFRQKLSSWVQSPRFWAVCFALWVCFVWGHSLLDGDASSAESSRFAFLLYPWLIRDIDLATFIIRKFAHFSEYAVLGIIAWQLRRTWRGVTASVRASVLPLVLMVAIPILDVTIQLSVPGRSGSPRDVLIDLAGACTGLLVARTLSGRRHG